jgi:hypothetical protein
VGKSYTLKPELILMSVILALSFLDNKIRSKT